MGTLSLIIGLIVFAVALFPNLGYFIIIPAIAGLIIGLCKVCRDGYCPWGMSGIVLNVFSVILALFWTAIISVSSTEMMEDAIREIQERPDVMQIFYPVAPQQHSVQKALQEKQSAPAENSPADKAKVSAPQSKN